MLYKRVINHIKFYQKANKEKAFNTAKSMSVYSSYANYDRSYPNQPHQPNCKTEKNLPNYLSKFKSVFNYNNLTIRIFTYI